MPVVAQNIADGYQFEFTCPQWAEMDTDSRAEWTVLTNDCEAKKDLGAPYAKSLLLGGGSSITNAQFITLMNTWLAALPVYDSDEDAVADGVYVYRTSSAHVQAPGGMIKNVEV